MPKWEPACCKAATNVSKLKKKKKKKKKKEKKKKKKKKEEEEVSKWGYNCHKCKK
jgi:hypothetical protein